MAKMAASVVRSLSLRIRLDADLRVSSDDVLTAVLEHVTVEEVSCFSRVQRGHYQVTVKTPDAKEKLMLTGIDVAGRLFPCYSVDPNTAMTPLQS